jgi:hypothetical protein
MEDAAVASGRASACSYRRKSTIPAQKPLLQTRGGEEERLVESERENLIEIETLASLA